MRAVVGADADQAHAQRVKLLFVPRELAQFAGAERSPVAAIKDQQQAPAAMGGEMEVAAILVLEGEIGRRLALGGSDLRLGIGHLRQHSAGRHQQENDWPQPKHRQQFTAGKASFTTETREIGGSDHRVIG